MALTYVRDLIRDALLDIGAIASGETPTAAEQSDALRMMNRMYGTWSNDGLTIPSYVREVFPLTPGKASYTMGPEGDWDTVRPVSIEVAKFTQPTTVVTEISPLIPGDPMAIPPTDDIPAVNKTEYFSTLESPIEIQNIRQYANQPNKDVTSSLQTKLYMSGTAPLETIVVWPVPSGANALVLYSHKEFSKFESANDVFSLPAGFEEATVSGLAVRLAPGYGKAITQEQRDLATDSLANIKRKNTQPVYATSDAYGFNQRRACNIYTGE